MERASAIGPPPAARDWLAHMLRCPTCEDELFAGDGEGGFSCPVGHRFPLVGGIPRFTPPSSYADSFGYEWTSFPRLQLDAGRRHESEEAFAEKTGLGPQDIAGRRVLDGGCGMGRFSDVVARWGAERLVAVDISRAVEPAAENLRAFDSAQVLQADLRNLPLAEASFDVVFSLGVLHHTPDTRRAFAQLARYVKPGGLLCVWVYARSLNAAHAGSRVLRPLTTRAEPAALLRVVRWAVPRLDAAQRRLPSPCAWILRRAIPISGHPDPDWRVLDTFDWYSPKYQWKHTYGEVEGWFRALGFEDVARLGFPVSVRGRRPLPRP